MDHLEEKRITRKEYAKRYRESHKQQIKEYIELRSEIIKKRKKAWSEKNKERLRIKRKKYRKEHKEALYWANKNYREKNAERVQTRKKRWYEENKKRLLHKGQQYQAENKERILKQKKEYYINHKDECRQRMKQYRIKNKKNINKSRVDQRKADPIKKMEHSLKNRLLKVLRESGIKKDIRSRELFGANREFIWNYLESQFKEGMTRENHGAKGWHIDHIKPCSSFNLADPEQQKICFHYTNLQPLWWWENLAKGSKII
jgi:hypothetical protein